MTSLLLTVTALTHANVNSSSDFAEVNSEWQHLTWLCEKCPCSVLEWAKGWNQCRWLQRGNHCGGKRRLCVLRALSVCFHGLCGSITAVGSAYVRPLRLHSFPTRVKVRKVYAHFPLIMCVYSITVSKQTVLLVMTTAATELNYVAHALMWAVRFECRGISKEIII